MEFVFRYRDFISMYYQNATKLYFQFFDSIDKTDEEIIIELIKSDLFNYNSGHLNVPYTEFIKSGLFKGPSWDPYTHEWKGLWNSPINFQLLDSNQFKRFNRTELNTFLSTYLMIRPWVERERCNFKDQVNWLKNDMDKCTSDIFFITCLEWFDKNDDILINGSKIIYDNTYYMLLSWIDKQNNTIILCELDAD